MALLSPVSPTALFTLSSKFNLTNEAQHACFVKNTYFNLFLVKSSNNDGAAAVVVKAKKSERKEVVQDEAEVKKEESLDSNGVVLKVEAEGSPIKDPRWVKGTWNLKMFEKNGTTDWDAVIDAEARRRKLLQDDPEPSSNDDPVLFDTSIVPWWAWIKRFHLPEAEKLNGRAAMIGFFMAYFVDSLTGAGLVTQTGNFFCKTLLFVSVVGVLFVRNNEDIETLKKLFEETTFYDKQWQATWQEDSSSNPSKK